MKWQIDEFEMEELCSRSKEDDPFHVFSHAPDEAAMQLSGSLEGDCAGHRDALRDRMSRRRAPFDRRAAELMAHVGVDPLSLVVMDQLLGGTVSVRRHGADEDDPAIVYMERDGKSFDGFVRLSPEVVWQFGGSVTIDGLPETIAMALKGRPLSDAVSHPVLDGKGHVIAAVRRETFGPRTYTHLEISPPVAFPDGDDLHGIRIGADA